MDTIKPRFLLVSLAALCVVVFAAAPTYHIRRTKVRCCVPDRDYQYKTFSPLLRSLSETALLLPEPAATEPLPASNTDPCDPRRRGVTKYFQFTKKPRLTIDHCSISEMVVLLHENGQWSVNLRANQNPRESILLNNDGQFSANDTLVIPNPQGAVPEGPNVTTAEKQRLFTEHLLRNQFYVKIYCYAAYGVGTQEPLVGRPVVIPIDLKPFWVQKQVPYLHFVTGCEPRLRRAFDLIDRVEIEFSYRYPTDSGHIRGLR